MPNHHNTLYTDIILILFTEDKIILQLFIITKDYICIPFYTSSLDIKFVNSYLCFNLIRTFPLFYFTRKPCQMHRNWRPLLELRCLAEHNRAFARFMLD